MLQRFVDKDVFSSLRDMQRLQRQLNRLIGADNNSFSAQEFPAFNVWTSDNGAIVRAEIPGVESEDVDISIVNDTLTIRGSQKAETFQNGETCHRQERGYGTFVRSIRMPFTVNVDGVSARFSDGVLHLEVPKAESEKPRKISVVSQ